MRANVVPAALALLGAREAAQALALLQHQGGHSRAGEFMGCGEARRPSPDDDDVRQSALLSVVSCDSAVPDRPPPRASLTHALQNLQALVHALHRREGVALLLHDVP